MSNFYKSLRAKISLAFQYLGYDVRRLPPRPRKTSDVVKIKVAGSELKIHGGNPLSRVYARNPRCNMHMARVAALIEKKYSAAWGVDVGANIGDTLAIVRSTAKMPVICVEGDNHCFALLQENAQRFKDVHLFNTFLSNKPGATFVKTEKEGWNTTLLETTDPENGREVRFETLDELSSRLKCQTAIKFLKVDTEGYDMRILNGAEKILTSARPVLSFEINKENIEPLGDDVGEFFNYLTGLGYCRFYLMNPDGGPVCILEANGHKTFMSLYQFSGFGRSICYLDVLAFHQDDEGLFEDFLMGENRA